MATKTQTPLKALAATALLTGILMALPVPGLGAPAEGGFARTWRETTLTWCGGVPETGLTGQVGMRAAVGFQAPPWADYLLAIDYYIMDDGIVNPQDPELPTTEPFEASVWAPGAETPGGLVLSWVPFGHHGYPEATWVQATLPSPLDITDQLTFPDRRFFVGLEWLYRNNPLIGVDGTPPVDLRSLRWNWLEWETITYGDLMIQAVVGSEVAPPPETIYVDWAGGGDYLTIREGLDAAVDGDTVYVAPGTYSGELNRELSFGGRDIVLKSQEGRSRTIIDCEALGRAFLLVDGEDEDAVIDGFTVRNGSASGGAVRCVNAYPTIVDCVFEDNDGGSWGGAMYLTDPVTPSPTIERCVFSRNEASLSGGAVRLDYSEAVFRNCTFVENAAPEGGGLSCGNLSFPTLENCIVALSAEGEGVSCPDASVPSITHSCVFGNAGGDSLCGWYAENLFLDPLLCDPSGGDYNLQADSPCRPEGNPWDELIGAWDGECGGTPVRESSWGRIKAMYR